MKKLILIIIIGFLLLTNAYALRINKPVRITDFDHNALVIINDALEKLWDITNGRYQPDVRYDDIRIAGLAVKTNATAPDLIAFAPATTNLLVYGFNGSATTEQAYFTIQLPHGYKEGTNIHPHILWTPIDTNTGTVVWSLEYTWANTDGTFSAPTTINSTALQAGGTAWVSKYSDFDDIDGTGKKVSSMLVCRLFRNPANDTYEQDAALLEIDFHYQIDDFGSKYEQSK